MSVIETIGRRIISNLLKYYNVVSNNIIHTITYIVIKIKWYSMYHLYYQYSLLFFTSNERLYSTESINAIVLFCLIKDI